MPRRTSRAVKKDTASAADTKNEAEAPRRSGRAASKPESPKKDASRSRRSSTAAQTAASVADSRSPRAKVPSRRESASPTDTRTRTGRSGVESTTVRVKPARRSTSKINYQESDGEEEAPAPKLDENFESDEEFEDSESDEKTKTQARGRASRASKGRGTPKSKSGSKSRRGRPTKKKQKDEEEDDECETFDVSDESMETEEKKAEIKKEPPKSRGRRLKPEVKAEEEKPKPSRKSGRTSSSKEETPTSKRPSRSSVRAKRYTEEEEEEEAVEEVDDAKAEEDTDVPQKVESGKKRKRDASPEEISKRLKEDEESAETKKSEKEKEDQVAEEPMEVEETDSVDALPAPQNKTEEVEISKPEESKPEEVKDVGKDKEEQKEDLKSEDTVQDSIEQKKTDESSKIGEKPKVNKEEPQVEAIATDTKDGEKAAVSQPEPVLKMEVKPEESNVSQLSETIKREEDNTAKAPTPEVPASTPLVPEVKSVVKVEKVEVVQDSTTEVKSKDYKNDDSPSSEEGKPLTIDETSPKEEGRESSSANGPQLTNDTPRPAQDNSNKSPIKPEHKEQITPTENGAHNDVQHNNLTPSEQYCPLPGRKYVANSKLSENILQSIKSKTFGFVSYNLGTDWSQGGVQKDKLLKELNTLDARIICLQQVARPFYTAVLEPSLDALGFKGIFNQPEDSIKGMATFYKSSLFRLTENSSVSMKKLIEKDIEASSLGAEDRSAVKSYIKKCGNVLFARLSAILGTQSITVANVQIPPTDLLSVQALQVSCIVREVIRINGGTNTPLLLGGEFNISEKDASYQLLRDGYLSNEMIEELQQRKDIVLPGKENASLVNLLWKSFQHPSSNLCSCYSSVLGQEFSIPESKRTSPDLLWYSSDSLHTAGVVDAAADKPGDHHLSLKADIAFSV